MGQLHRLFSKSSASSHQPLVPVVANLISQEGLGGLVLRFAACGLGPQVESWIQPGPNQRLSPRQLRTVFSIEQLDEIAGTADLTPKAAEQGLATLLPRAIDRLTPNGMVPPAANIRRSLGHLDGLIQAS